MKTPKTHINTYINTGATNEIDSQRGISHFCEHMLFNGTSGTNGYIKLSTGDVFRKVEEMGGYTNACTGPAQTSYTIEVPSEKQNIEKAIQIQSAMMFNCSMSDDMVKKEHYPVCSEINMYSDMIPIKANNIATKNLYNINSTSEDIVAGRVDNIQNIDHKKVMDYYKQNYTPENMTTVITGDITPDEAIKLVAKNFKEPAKQNQNNRTFEKLTPITKTVRQDLVSPKTLATCATIAFNGPENSNLKDQIALELVLDILFGKSNSRISTPLKELNTNIEPSVSKLGALPTNGQIITFDIDTNGILKVSAKDLDTGKEQSITITANDKMSDAEIEQAIRDAEQYASQDETRRQLMTVQNDAAKLVHKVENALTHAGKRIEKAEKKQIKSDVAALQKLLMKKPDKMTDSDLDEIRRAMGQLQSSSANLCRIAEEKKEGEK